MNKPARPRVILILLAFYAVSFCLLLAYGAFLVVGDEVILPSFKLAYGLRWGIALFLEHLIAIHVSAILIAYSLFLSTQTSSEAGGARWLQNIGTPKKSSVCPPHAPPTKQT